MELMCDVCECDEAVFARFPSPTRRPRSSLTKTQSFWKWAVAPRRWGYISYSRRRLRLTVAATDAASALMWILYLTVAMNRKLNTKTRLHINPCFDLQLCSQALSPWIKASLIKFLFRMPNLTHHSRMRSSENWEDFGIEPPLFLFERSQLVQVPGPGAPFFLGVLCIAYCTVARAWGT